MILRYIYEKQVGRARERKDGQRKERGSEKEEGWKIKKRVGKWIKGREKGSLVRSHLYS